MDEQSVGFADFLNELFVAAAEADEEQLVRLKKELLAKRVK
jgi:hypothetical protein